MQHNGREVVFFDLDGALHQQDMFGSFLRYLLRNLPLSLLLVVAMGPAILAGLTVYRRVVRWLMSLLLWASTFGRCGAVLKRLGTEFVDWFRHHVTTFPVVHARLTAYLTNTNVDVWLIAGSPQSLVEQVYHDALWLPRVNLIANRIARRWGGWTLTLRYLGHEKVMQLKKKTGAPLWLYGGYDNNEQDSPLLDFCQHR